METAQVNPHWQACYSLTLSREFSHPWSWKSESSVRNDCQGEPDSGRRPAVGKARVTRRALYRSGVLFMVVWFQTQHYTVYSLLCSARIDAVRFILVILNLTQSLLVSFCRLDGWEEASAQDFSKNKLSLSILTVCADANNVLFQVKESSCTISSRSNSSNPMQSNPKDSSTSYYILVI